MKWKGWALIALVAIGCGNEKEKENQNPGSAIEKFFAAFPQATLPYELADSSIKKKSDQFIPEELATGILPDSIQKAAPGSGKVQYTGLARMEAPEGDKFLILKTTKGNSRAAFLLVFDNENQFAGSLPFLIPEPGSSTTKTSSVDKKFAITRHTVRKKGTEVVDGKNVFAWDHASKSFSWVMTDVPDDSDEIINPIDTFPQQHKLSGDYVKDKKNVVFIRDGRYPNQLQVFIHTEKNRNCNGEIKGNFIVTSSNTAVYREPGDPCVLQLKFSGNAVTLSEQQGCGNYRGLDCPFSGTFKKKKQPAGRNEKKS